MIDNENTISAIDRAEAESVLNDGIGAQAVGYSFEAVGNLAGCDRAIVATKDATDPVYVLIDDAMRDHQPKVKAIFMLEVAIAVTKILRTMVIPVDTPAPSLTHWRGKRGPFVAYRFKVVAPSTAIQYG